MGQADLSERGKAQEVEKLYARARAGRGAKKAKPTRAQREHGKQKGPRLDARMRADQRQARRTALTHTALFIGTTWCVHMQMVAAGHMQCESDRAARVQS